ncbi:chondroitin AC/alginate lyase [Penicillium canescens]|uniref:Chondroitin AC/alginate lyase n=1 Tax=Penicillium canescens TaxID=5083 RepID=A0AAD6I3J4_PENCN|nr:chondroitin AC/alginate lyase [Penicillium canescens]
MTVVFNIAFNMRESATLTAYVWRGHLDCPNGQVIVLNNADTILTPVKNNILSAEQRGDGEYPVAARGESSSHDAIVEYWFDQDTFRGNEQAQETCRDLEHTGHSLASISHIVYGTDPG